MSVKGSRLTTVWSSLWRLAHCALVVARHGLKRAAGDAARRLPWVSDRLAPAATGPEAVRRLLEELGGSFIKLGQVLALQPDIVPRRYCDAFFDLMDRMPPFDEAAVERVVREELGRAPEEIFDTFDRQPIASASIAQVHVARLGDRKLAVKLQRPNARRDFGGDIQLMGWTAAAIRWLRLGRLDWLAMALEEFVAWTGEELDFRAEARFMDRLAANSRDRDRERVPEVVWSQTTARVLTAEYLEGTTLLGYLRGLESGDEDVRRRLADAGFEPERFAENVLENFLHDVFHHGVFHADLHPANLLILPGNTVGYVDFGISGVVSEYARFHLVSTVMALTRADVGGAADHLLELAELGPDSDTRRFRRELADLGETWFGRVPGSRRLEKRRSYTEILLDTLEMSRRLRILPHPEAMRYMRSVITLDGLIGRFAPAMDRDTVIERHCSQLLESAPAAALVSFDQWVDWLWAGARLARDGAARLDRALDRLERRANPGLDFERPRRGPERPAARAFWLGVTAAALAALAVTLGQPPRLGLNLFTAELAVVAGALGLLLREVLPWRRSRR